MTNKNIVIALFLLFMLLVGLEVNYIKQAAMIFSIYLGILIIVKISNMIEGK